jgi:hypothetical protein
VDKDTEVKMEEACTKARQLALQVGSPGPGQSKLSNAQHWMGEKASGIWVDPEFKEVTQPGVPGSKAVELAIGEEEKAKAAEIAKAKAEAEAKADAAEEEAVLSVKWSEKVKQNLEKKAEGNDSRWKKQNDSEDTYVFSPTKGDGYSGKTKITFTPTKVSGGSLKDNLRALADAKLEGVDIALKEDKGFNDQLISTLQKLSSEKSGESSERRAFFEKQLTKLKRQVANNTREENSLNLSGAGSIHSSPGSLFHGEEDKGLGSNGPAAG